MICIGKAKGRVSVDEDDAEESSDPQGDDDASERSEDAKDGVTSPSEDDGPEEDAKGIVPGKKMPRPSAKKTPISGQAAPVDYDLSCDFIQDLGSHCQERQARPW